MKKNRLMLSALALSLSMACAPAAVFAAETASSSSQQLPSLAPMLEKVMPSVVSINVEGSTAVKTPRMPQQFQQFFGDNCLSVRMDRLFRDRRSVRVAVAQMMAHRAMHKNSRSARSVPASLLTQRKAMWLPTTT